MAEIYVCWPKFLVDCNFQKNFFEILPREGCFWLLKVHLGALELQRQILIFLAILTTIFLV